MELNHVYLLRKEQRGSSDWHGDAFTDPYRGVHIAREIINGEN
jgi:hypothetical protein